MRISDWSSDVCSSDLLYIGQKAHLYGAHALAFANGAAPVARVERKPCRRPSANPRIACIGKKLAHVVPETDVRGRARARRLAYGGLVDFQNPVHCFPVRDAGAVVPGPSGSLPTGVACG